MKFSHGLLSVGYDLRVKASGRGAGSGSLGIGVDFRIGAHSGSRLGQVTIVGTIVLGA